VAVQRGNGPAGSALVLHAHDHLGEAVAEVLVGAGWAVGLQHGADGAPAERLATRIEATGGHALALPADLADPVRVGYMVDSLAAHFGPVLVVVGRHDDRLESARSPVVSAVAGGMADRGYGRLVALRLPGEAVSAPRAPEGLPAGVALRTLEVEPRGSRRPARLVAGLMTALAG
jgi:NAD(P)-dependent dehydrogenase (short-subunit alcohol dehydrogenase family)